MDLKTMVKKILAHIVIQLWKRKHPRVGFFEHFVQSFYFKTSVGFFEHLGRS